MIENTSQKPASGPAAPAPLTSGGAAPMTGRFVLPGDASIARAALLFGALAVGRSRIEGVAMAGSLPALVAALRQLGVRLTQDGDAWLVDGLGVGGLLEPEGPIAVAQAADIVPLLVGLLAPHDFPVRLAGVAPEALAGLRQIVAPMGVPLDSDDDSLILRGSAMIAPLRATDPSGPAKAALLLAAAQTAGISTIVEKRPAPDHMEKLLAAFGGMVAVDSDEAGETTTRITGLAPLRPRHVTVPGDPTLAAYPLLAGLIVPGSDLLVANVPINPTRTGLIDTLLEMGGDIQFLNQHESGSEPVADLRVRSSRLKGVTVGVEHAAAMPENLPVLAIAAAYAQGETTVEGFGAEDGPGGAMVAGLVANGVDAELQAGRLSIAGRGAAAGGGTIAGRPEPHVAMSFLLLGLASKQAVTIEDAGAIEAAFPGLLAAMTGSGARLSPAKGVLA